MLIRPDNISAFSEWIETAAGDDDEMFSVLADTIWRHRQLHGGAFFEGRPGDKYVAAARVYRGLIVLLEDGRVRSVDRFRVDDANRLWEDPDYRNDKILGNKWDDRSRSFNMLRPPRKVREQPVVIGFEGETADDTIEDQVRQFEYLLNIRLEQMPKSKAKILMPLPPRVEDKGIPVNRPLKPDYRESLKALLLDVSKQEWKQALDAFRERLSPEIVSNLQRGGLNSCRDHNWMCGYSVAHNGIDETLGVCRRQAAQAFPMLARMFSAPDGKLPQAVDNSEPLVPAMADVFNEVPSVVRRLNGLSIDAFDFTYAPEETQIRDVVQTISRLPPGPAPKSSAGWKSFRAMIALHDAISNVVFNEHNPAPALLAKAANHWEDLDHEAINRASVAFPDMVSDLTANVFHPGEQFHKTSNWTRADTALTILGNRDISQLIDAVELWQDNYNAIRAALAQRYPRILNPVLTWPALHEGSAIWQSPNGLFAVVLNTSEMLREEHDRMNHCVDTYVGACLYKGHHIVSIRTPDGKSIATAEIRQSDLLPLVKASTDAPDGYLRSHPPGVIQFRGYDNKDASDKAYETIWAYVSALLGGALKVNKQQLEEALAERKKHEYMGSGADAANMLSAAYEATSEEALADAWRAYAPVFPKQVQRKGLSAILAAPPSEQPLPAEKKKKDAEAPSAAAAPKP